MEHTDLLHCLQRRFNIDELKTLCFKLGIEHELFNSSNHEAFARELIRYCERNNLYDELVTRCEIKGSGEPAVSSGTRLREHDFSVFSDCHANLLRLRNLFENALPVPKFEPRRLGQIAQYAENSLHGFPVLRRVMGEKWAADYRDTIVKAVIISEKTSGRDVMKEAHELGSKAEDEVRAFFGEVHEKQNLTKRMDQLLQDIENRMR